MALNLNYYYGNEANQFCFLRIPKVMFTEPSYKSLSTDAKLLYGLMLDRMGLSVRNRKMDADGRVYIFFTLETVMGMLGVGHNKAVRLFRELELTGLIERKKQGQGKPAVIYVKNFIPPEPPKPESPDGPGHPHGSDASATDAEQEDAMPYEDDTEWDCDDALADGADGPLNDARSDEDDDADVLESSRDGLNAGSGDWNRHTEGDNGKTGWRLKDGADQGEKEDEKVPETVFNTVERSPEDAPVQTSRNRKSTLPAYPQTQTSRFEKSALPTSQPPQTSRNGQSAIPQKGSPDCPKWAGNNTNQNNTDFNNINLSPPTPSRTGFPTLAEIRAYRMTSEERRKEMEDCRESVREQIGYDLLIQEHPGDQRRIDGYVEILAEALCCEDEYQRIGQKEYSMYEVRDRLYQLTSEHISYVMDSMKRTTSRIVNPRAYTLAALFNAPLTIDRYYDSLAARDTNQGGYAYNRNSYGYRRYSDSSYVGRRRAG